MFNEQIKSLVAQNAVPELDKNQIFNDSTFTQMGYDSLQFIKLIVDVEESFNINISDDLLDAKLFENYVNFETAISNVLLKGNVSV